MPSALDTTARLRAAGKNADVDEAMATFAEHAVVHSPLTNRVDFHGREEIRRLFETVYANLNDLDHHTDLGDEHTRTLIGTATARGQRIDTAFLVRLDGAAKITELTLFIRPLPGLVAVMAALGPPLARRNGRSRLTAAALTAMIKPLELATRFGDRIGIKLAFPPR